LLYTANEAQQRLAALEQKLMALSAEHAVADKHHSFSRAFLQSRYSKILRQKKFSQLLTLEPLKSAIFADFRPLFQLRPPYKGS
jgi:hypothetical protein